jgi:hypothetical protein
MHSDFISYYSTLITSYPVIKYILYIFNLISSIFLILKYNNLLCPVDLLCLYTILVYMFIIVVLYTITNLIGKGNLSELIQLVV